MFEFNNEQLRAIHHKDGPALILAGPGSGKTSVITGRLNYLINECHVDPNRILVITFSKEAAKEMQQRFSQMMSKEDLSNQSKVHFGTFHAVFYHILKKQNLYHNDSVLTQNQKREYVKEIGFELNIKESVSIEWQNDILSKISMRKTGLELYLDNEDEKESTVFNNIFCKYNEKCKELSKLDFDDMIIECSNYFNRNKHALKKWQNRFDFFLIDEFQDIDNLQYKLVKLLSNKTNNLFCVGDDDQSIYSFRGANPQIMQNFIDDYKNITVIKLNVNYRSGSEIVKRARNVIKNNKERFEKEQICKSETGEGEVIYKCFENAEKEAEYISKEIFDLSKNPLIKKVGVLYRSTICKDIIEDSLRINGISYISKDISNNIFDKEWVKDILAYLCVAEDVDYYNNIIRIMNRPYRGISRECVFSGKKYKEIDDLVEKIKYINGMPPVAAINYIIYGLGYHEYLNIKYKFFNSQKILNEDINLLKDKIRLLNSIKDVLLVSGILKSNSNDFIYDEISESKEININEKIKRVDTNKYMHEKCIENSSIFEPVVLQTIHASKGLEYDAVFIVGLQEGIFPHKKASGNASIEEERRLFYVAATRAKQKLYLLGRHKDDYGKQESRFIHESGIIK